MKPYKIITLIVFSVLAAVALPGCLGDTGGIAPPDDELIYPVALATIRDDSHLLVVNSNFDLEYNAGTLVAYQLANIDMFNGSPIGYDSDKGIFILPSGIPLSRYCTGGMSGSWCNLSTSAGIVADETIHLGAYASDLNITPDKDRALVPVRGEQAIIVVDLPQGNNLLECGESADDERRCNDAHKITGNGREPLPMEPHHVETMNYVQTNDDGVEETVTMGFATHRAGGEVSLFSVSSSAGNATPVGNELIKVINGVIEGASGIAVNPRAQDILVVGQRDFSPHVAVLDVETDWRSGSLLNDPAFGQYRTIAINENDYISGGNGARDIAVSPDGKTGFVITESPAALLKIDLERYQVTDMVTVCRESSRVETYVDEGDPDDAFDDKMYAFVLCFLTSQVYIVDADFMIPVIRKTGAGPQDIAFDAEREIAYIANFTDSTITMIQAVAPFNMIQVRTAEGTDDALRLRIGEPRLPKGY